MARHTRCCCGPTCKTTIQLSDASNWTPNGGTATNAADGFVAVSGVVDPASTMDTEAYLLTFQFKGQVTVSIDGVDFAFDLAAGTNSMTGGGGRLPLGGITGTFFPGASSATAVIRVTPTHAYSVVVAVDDLGDVYAPSVTSDPVGTLITVDSSSTPSGNFTVEGVFNAEIKNFSIQDSKVVYDENDDFVVSCYTPNFPQPYEVWRSMIQDDFDNWDLKFQPADSASGALEMVASFPSLVRTDGVTRSAGTNETIQDIGSEVIYTVNGSVPVAGSAFGTNDYRHIADSSHQYNGPLQNGGNVNVWRTVPPLDRYHNCAKQVGGGHPTGGAIAGFNEAAWGAFTWVQFYEGIFPKPFTPFPIPEFDEAFHDTGNAGTSPRTFEYLAPGFVTGIGADMLVDGQAYYSQPAHTAADRYPKPFLRAELNEVNQNGVDSVSGDLVANDHVDGFTLSTARVRWEA